MSDTRKPYIEVAILFLHSRQFFLAFTIAAAVTSWNWFDVSSFWIFDFLYWLATKAQLFFTCWSFLCHGHLNTILIIRFSTDLPDEPIMWLITVLFLAYFLFRRSEISAKTKHPLIFFCFAVYCG
jgi:hypothetical protein